MRKRSRALGLFCLVVVAISAPARAQAPAGPEFEVSGASPAMFEEDAGLSVFDDGRFVVAWNTRETTGDRVFARRFAADGSPLGPMFQVNSVNGTITSY